VARLCERPGCSVPAEVSYGFDPDDLSVWLDAMLAVPGVRAGVLCRRHADAMVVPLGWMLDDRREPVPRLFRPPAETGTGPIPRPRPPRAPRRPRLEQLPLDEPVAAGAAPAPVAAPAPPERVREVAPAAELAPPEPAAPAAPPGDVAWRPVFDQRDDLHGLLKARGRLLSRAFRGIADDADAGAPPAGG